MKLLIHGRNLEVTLALRDYTETKLARAVNHFNGMVQEARHLSVARNPRVPQQTAITLFASGTVIRAQKRSQNLYASIDLVAGKLARQLQRHKDRRQGHGHHDEHQAIEVMPLQGECCRAVRPSCRPCAAEVPPCHR